MTTRIHVRPVGDLKIKFPNGRILPPQGGMVKRTLFVERRLRAKEIEIVTDQTPPLPSADGETPAPVTATVDDAAAVATTSEETEQ